MKLGFNMAGTEELFENIIREQASIAMNENRVFRYLEHGIAQGKTLSSVAHAIPISECHGVDLLGGEYFNANQFLIDNKDLEVSILTGERTWSKEAQSMVRIFLCGDGEEYIPGVLFDFVLIDGCHGANCVVNDFNRYSYIVRMGGVIAFHDAYAEDQGQGWQRHCNEPINVLAGLDRLGLIMNKLSGWKMIGQVGGDKSREGNGFMFFRRES